MTKEVIPGAPVVGLFSEIIVPTDVQRNAFLEMIARGAAMHAAADKLDLPYMAFARLLKSDKQFENDFVIARAMRNFALEEMFIEQATVGVDEVQTHQGRIVYEYVGDYELNEAGDWKPRLDAKRVPVTVKKLITSNPSLLAILKANYQEKYRDRSEINVNNRTPGALAPDSVPDRITSENDRDKLIALLDKRARARAVVIDVDPDEDLL